MSKENKCEINVYCENEKHCDQYDPISENNDVCKDMNRLRQCSCKQVQIEAAKTFIKEQEQSE